jgi:hypothetical protein
VFTTTATCVPVGDSFTWLGAGAQVMNCGAELAQLNVTVPLKPGIGVSSSPIAICPPGETGIGVVGLPPAGGTIVSVNGTATMFVVSEALAVADPPPETFTVFTTVVGEVAVTFTATVIEG